MRAPRFWSRPPGALAAALGPAAALWRAGGWVRTALARPVKAPVPVLCIGNLTAGGTGKSPMVAALLARLGGQGLAAHVLSRGYGGTVAGPHRVDALRDRAAEVGDEPLMLAAHGPVWVARDRVAGAHAAAQAGADLVLMDDGLQNPGLVKDAAIVMVDAGAGFGNGRVIPAGPLREPVAAGLARADLAVLVGPAPARAATLAAWPELGTVPVVGAEAVPLETGFALAGEPVVAFAGIGRPAKFFDTLRAMGAEIVAAHGFPDHHAYAPAILRRLLAEARGQDAMLVTTEKDAVRLPAEIRREVITVQIRLEPEDWAPIDALVRKICAKSP